MKTDRRNALVMLLAGAAMALAALAARKGVPGAGKLATRLGKPLNQQAKTEYYGYKEINLS